MSKRRVASYGRTPDKPQCKNCGEIVSPEIARVIGDNEGNVPRCRNCSVGKGSTTYAALAERRSPGFHR